MRLTLPTTHAAATPLDRPFSHAWELGWALLAAAMLDYMADAEADDEDEPAICSTCNGSGEGMADGTTCRDCRGSGETRDLAAEEDRAIAEADAAYDREKDERAERERSER